MRDDATRQTRHSIRLPHPVVLLFCGALVMGMLVGLAAYFHPTARLIREVTKLGGTVKTEPGGPEWLQNLVGEKWLTPLHRVTEIDLNDTAVTNEWLASLTGRDDLEILHLRRTAISDAGIALIRHIPKLRALHLYQTEVGDDALKYLKELPRLEHLPMGYTHITDAGLVHLPEMPQLNYIGFRGDKITDEGLVHVASLKNLTGLFLSETDVTDAGLWHLYSLKKLRKLNLSTVAIRNFVATESAAPETMEFGGLSLTPMETFHIGTAPSDLMRVTDSGLFELKKALPGLTVECEYWLNTPVGIDDFGSTLFDPSFLRFTGEIVSPDFGSGNP